MGMYIKCKNARCSMESLSLALRTQKFVPYKLSFESVFHKQRTKGREIFSISLFSNPRFLAMTVRIKKNVLLI